MIEGKTTSYKGQRKISGDLAGKGTKKERLQILKGKRGVFKPVYHILTDQMYTTDLVH